MDQVKVGIIGMGFVGDALKTGMEDAMTNIKVVPYDPYTIPDSKLENIADTEYAFICVPTPMSKGGEIDDSIVRQVLDDLNTLAYDGIVVVKGRFQKSLCVIRGRRHNNDKPWYINEPVLKTL